MFGRLEVFISLLMIVGNFSTLLSSLTYIPEILLLPSHLLSPSLTTYIQCQPQAHLSLLTTPHSTNSLSQTTIPNHKMSPVFQLFPVHKQAWYQTTIPTPHIQGTKQSFPATSQKQDQLNPLVVLYLYSFNSKMNCFLEFVI